MNWPQSQNMIRWEMVRPSRSAAPGNGSRATRNLDVPLLLHLYEQMLLLRRFESVAQIACRKGETPGFLHLYIGEEATAVGVCAHLRPTDWITSTHRGHGHALAKGMDPHILMAELFGKRDGCCGGRGGTMHLYDRSVGLFGTNGIVAAGISHAVGVGISARRRKDATASASPSSATAPVNHGGFHEALNFAGVQRAPAVFVCENNLYATATPLEHARRSIPRSPAEARPTAFPASPSTATTCSPCTRRCARRCDRARRGDGPTLIEAKTYRTVGHHEGDPVTGTYRTQAEVDAWATRDPVSTFREQADRRFRGGRRRRELDAIDATDREGRPGRAGIRHGARLSPIRRRSVFHVFADPLNPPAALAATPKSGGHGDRAGSMRCATASPRRCGATRHILYFGEGTGERGGTFAHTKGLWQEFGPQRMVDTPISEQGFTGAAIGASATGARTIADLMFADFMFEAGGQIVLQAAKLRYMSNGQMNAPMVVRVGAGAVRSAGPHHSGAYHPMWAHVPGLIVCLPSTPADAKGLMKTALRAGDPGADAGDEGAVRDQGRGARGRAPRAVRRRPHRARRQGPDHRRRPASSCIAAWKRRRRWRARASTARSSTSGPSCRSTSRRSPKASPRRTAC